MTVYEYQLALMGIAVKDKMYIHVLSKISSFTHKQWLAHEKWTEWLRKILTYFLTQEEILNVKYRDNNMLIWGKVLINEQQLFFTVRLWVTALKVHSAKWWHMGL